MPTQPEDRQMIYAIVEARRLQWDNLLWQVPVLSFTAQAFLFSIALAADTTTLARIIVMLLSIVITFLSSTLMARHRQAEMTDSLWLEEFEKDWSETDRQHGTSWMARRDKPKKLGGGILDMIRPPRGYITWQVGLLLFGTAAAAVIVISLVAPGQLGVRQG